MKRLLFVFVLLLLPAATLAAEFRTDHVGSGETVKNLYLYGDTVTSDANVGSDLVTAGGDLSVNGNVETDLFAAGGTVRVKGNVGKNARVAGGTVYIDGNVGEDLSAVGGTLIINGSSTVNGDLLIAGGNVEINGKVLGNVWVGGAGTLKINGQVTGNVDVKGTGELTVGRSAVIGGKLKYASENEAKIDQGASVQGGVEFNRTNQTALKASTTASSVLVKLLAGLVTVLLVVLLFPRTTANVSMTAITKVWASLGIGFAFLLLAPLAVVVLFVTVIGYELAFILILAYILFLIGAGIFSSIIVGSWVWKLAGRETEYMFNWKTVVLGVVLTTILAIIPVLGWLVLSVLYLVALGAIIISIFNQSKFERA